jgi:hypothetical protein
MVLDQDTACSGYQETRIHKLEAITTQVIAHIIAQPPGGRSRAKKMRAGNNRLPAGGMHIPGAHRFSPEYPTWINGWTDWHSS